MGGQPLYTLSVTASADSVVAQAPVDTFGVRTVTSFLTPPSALAPHGVREYVVNGQPLLVRGAGWAENLFLHYSASDIATQISLIRNLGLNMIRSGGEEMPANFYDQMDRAGILIDAGFQCCYCWQLPPDGRGVTRSGLRHHGQLGLCHRTDAAQPPQRGQLQLERRGSHPPSGGGHPRCVRSCRL